MHSIYLQAAINAIELLVGCFGKTGAKFLISTKSTNYTTQITCINIINASREETGSTPLRIETNITIHP